MVVGYAAHMEDAEMEAVEEATAVHKAAWRKEDLEAMATATANT